MKTIWSLIATLATAISLNGCGANGQGQDTSWINTLSAVLAASGKGKQTYVPPATNSDSNNYVTPVNTTQRYTPPATTYPQAGNNGGGSKDPFVYSENVNHCLVTQANPSRATKNRWRNQCSFKIDITFCNVKSGRDECQMRLTGGQGLAPGGSQYLLNDERTSVYIACKDPYYLPSSKLTWSGSGFQGKYQMAAR